MKDIFTSLILLVFMIAFGSSSLHIVQPLLRGHEHRFANARARAFRYQTLQRNVSALFYLAFQGTAPDATKQSDLPI